MGIRMVSAESVTEGHPDKVCDQISDAILDELIRQAQLSGADVSSVRCAAETLVTQNDVFVAGETRSDADIDVEKAVRDTIRRIGYSSDELGFNADTCAIKDMLHSQSSDIAQGVDGTEYRSDDDDEVSKLGAGDQGIIYGYATNETPTRIPMPLYAAHKLAQRLADVRKDGTIAYLRPDGKTQVTVEYDGDRPVRIDTVLVSTQHDDDVDVETIRHDVISSVIDPTLDEVGLPYDGVRILVNPTGRFVLGGPAADTGLTGRKLVVDSYGGTGRVGGGVYSGKDPTKVDRSAAYATRWAAKSVVDAWLARRCEVQIAYAIGVPEPVSMYVDTFGTARYGLSDTDINRALGEAFDFRPGAIIRSLGLWRPMYEQTAAYGHFGRTDVTFPWEDTSKTAANLRGILGIED